MLPSLSSTSPCGPDLGVLRRYSLNSAVLGSRRPKRLAICPVYQIDPSGVASGSCGCEPRVGTTHSFMETSTPAGTPAGFASSEAYWAKYCDLNMARFGDEGIRSNSGSALWLDAGAMKKARQATNARDGIDNGGMGAP